MRSLHLRMAGIGGSGASSRCERRGKLGRKRIGDVTARVVIYEAFVERKFEALMAYTHRGRLVIANQACPLDARSAS